MGPRLIFIVFSRVCFSFLNLPVRLAGTRQRRVFVESHRANTACGNTVEVPARPTPWIRNLYLPPAPILPQPPHKNKTIKPSSQGAAGRGLYCFDAGNEKGAEQTPETENCLTLTGAGSKPVPFLGHGDGRHSMRRQQKRPCRLVLANHAYTIPCFKWFVKHFLSVFEINFRVQRHSLP